MTRMTRLLLTWIGLAILQLGIPRSTSAAELLRHGGESTSAVPRPESPTKGAVTPDRSQAEALQGAHVTPFAPAASPRIRHAPAHGALPADALRQTGPASLPHVLPDARAPPA